MLWEELFLKNSSLFCNAAVCHDKTGESVSKHFSLISFYSKNN